MKPRRQMMFLVAPLLVAALLRFQGLKDQGIFLFDEGAYLLQTQKLLHYLEILLKNIPTVIAGATIESDPFWVRVHDLARPFHLALLSLAGATPTGGLFLIASIGVASIGLLSLLARRIGRNHGPEHALFFAASAAFLLATSPAHLFHSRTLLAEVDAGFFLLGALFALCGRDRAVNHYAAGFLLGSGLLTQSRLLPVIILLVLWRAWTLRSFQTLVRICVGVAAPVLLVEAGYALINVGLTRIGLTPKLPGYVDQMIMRSRLDGGGFALNRPFFGIRYLLLVESAPAVLLALVGAMIAIRRRERFLTMIAGLTLFTILFASLFEQRYFPNLRYGRMLAPAIPLLALLGARLLASLQTIPRWGRGAALALLLLTLLARAPLLTEIVSMKSDFELLFRAVISVAGAPVISDEAIQAMASIGYDQIGTPGFHPAPKTAVYFGIQDWRYPLFELLSDTPTFYLQRNMLSPTVMTTLEMIEDPAFTLRVDPVRPVKVYILPAD